MLYVRERCFILFRAVGDAKHAEKDWFKDLRQNDQWFTECLTCCEMCTNSKRMPCFAEKNGMDFVIGREMTKLNSGC